ncbi:MAG: endonuclease MutS2 [Spirochaetaceae bacterium]|nr:MAG: endonuclease MutS2 [Spirochaetaceae bacterium]
MNEHTLRLLSFYRIIDQVKEHASGPAGQRLIAEQKIMTDPVLVAVELGRAHAMRKILDSGISMPAFDLPDVEHSEKLLSKEGTVLEAADCAAIARVIHTGSLLRRFFSAEDIDAGLTDCVASFPNLTEIEKRIYSIMDSDGEILFKNVPALASLQNACKKIRSEIEKLALSYMNSTEYSGYFQADVASLKDGRTVLPLKTQHKGRIKGIVHDVSGTGQTIFLEPQDLVEKNNELVIKENALRNEVHRILRELTDVIRVHLDDLAAIRASTAYLDMIHARALYAIDLKCNPALSSKSSIIILNARHPLLGPTCVPISFSLEDKVQILLITGPNTGGKTVSVKTLGLLALMNQSGMEIPVDEGSTLPVFGGIFADIGDEQSIEQSLSTFQAHMKNIAEICAKTDSRSLVLLDELGSGTDPEEGTAISMALLDLFLDRGTKVLATTHHGILKNYGYMKSGVMNASMEFDVTRLAPTYRIIMGIPGESHALTIAEHTGVPIGVIKQADSYLEEERTDISRLIDELSREKRKLLEQEQIQKEKDRAAEEKIRDASLKELSLKQKERELREKGLVELTSFLRESRRALEQIIREIREGGDETVVTQGRQLIQAIAEQVVQEEARLDQLHGETPEDPEAKLIPGMSVRVKKTGQEGEIVRQARDNGYVVRIGNMRVSLAATELIPLKARSFSQDQVDVVYSRTQSTEPAVFELNVRGFRLAQAMRAVEKQMDAAVVSGIKEWSIVHGKGTGTLQTAIHDYLKDSPFVASFSFARPEFGGSGKTIVILKS